MKVFFLLIIVLLSSLIGYLYGEGFRNRLSQLRELKRALIDFENDIVYTYTPLPESIESIALKAKSPIKELFNEISFKLKNNEVENVYMAFKESINEHKKEMNLRNKDFEILLDLSKSLGETNVDGQIKIFNLAKEKLDIELEIAEDECNKNTKVYRCLGVAVGAMIAIFLV
ncbi:stage III sporulation protein SpoIIIAB [Clostridium perfringens]|uniref:stage III sporulation protein SpoIIIAB n=1 Tax=Clostridium perfringens TaxID=1502 RepID=UPI002902D10F|nr:stage III sporulation protein SpoAB [Clostridium perfringens]EHA0994724.1 stage III sporulation protein SpoAB [Clostridium perfringens]EHA1185575.1 stage III sporulation protein SpoAB [Clostridium perfringens]EJT6144356.1 stage III sporulation protein SpoAB [Clostridium perfringens]MDK0897329.1 stage III sporulation protein SpoIIIAB [Clostridium perfringens]